MRRALILLVLVLLSACNAVRTTSSTSIPSRAQFPGRNAQVGHGAIVEVRLIYADGYTVILPVSVLVPPSPSPSPTNTPAPSPTSTATVTPSPTATDTPLPQVDSSPTPEDARTPSPTPRPTSTPTPTPTPPIGKCALIVTNGPLNVRATPGGTWLGQVQVGDTLAPDGYALLNGVRWWRFYWEPDVSGWVHSAYVAVKVETDCSGVPDVTPKVFYDGFHTLSAQDTGAILAPAYIGKYHLLKCLDNGFAFCQQAKAANPALITIYRSYQYDCPPEWVYTSPEVWWRTIEGALPSGASYYEVMNECDPPLAMAGVWAQFMIGMAKIIERERGAALLAFSSGPGNPDFGWWRGMWAYVDWASGRLAPNGLPHGIATHSSGYAPASIVLPSGSWINNPYISGREKIVCELARANNYGADCNSIVWINSEIGISDGYSGTKDLFTCAQKGIIYQETIRRKIEDGVVDGFNWWNVGKIGNWSSDADCLAEMLLP